MKYPIAIIVGAFIFGGFYSYSEHKKQLSLERQLQMRIEQDNQQKELEQTQKAAEAKIKAECSAYLDRNGNYLVSNETLNTNYNACLHANGL
jgi:hypothetical protein